MATDVKRQAIKHDGHKPDYSLLTSAMLEPMTRALMYGQGKYSRGNFKQGFENIRLTSAALRHIFAYLDREEQDPESGITHLGHAMAALAMLLDNIAEGVSTDARYPTKKGDRTSAATGQSTVGGRDSTNLSHPTNPLNKTGLAFNRSLRQSGFGGGESTGAVRQRARTDKRVTKTGGRKA